MNKEIIEKTTLFAALRVLSTDNIHKAPYYKEKEAWKLVADLVDNTEGMLLLSSSLGLDIHKNDIYGGVKNADAPISMLLNACITEDKLTDIITKTYGEDAAFAFMFAQTFLLASVFTGFLQYLDLRSIPKHRKKLFEQENRDALEFLHICSQFHTSHRYLIERIFGDNICQLTKNVCAIIKSSKPNCEWAKKIYNATENLVNNLFPQYPDISARLNRARKLKKKIENCSIGIKNWRMYETLCIEILRFLFVPPFKKVMVQVKSEGNKERRDAILPNNQYSGFWSLISQEFGARHIVKKRCGGRC